MPQVVETDVRTDTGETLGAPAHDQPSLVRTAATSLALVLPPGRIARVVALPSSPCRRQAEICCAHESSCLAIPAGAAP